MRWKLAQWFEKRWWKSYLRDKSPEAYLDWKRNYWSNFLETIEVSVEPNAMVLDAGCGPAGLFLSLTDAKVTAVDPLLDYYTEQIGHFNPSEHIHCTFHKGSIEKLGFQDLFDFVFCLNVINHVQNIKASIDQLAQAAKFDATVVISIDCHNYLAPKWLFRLLPLDILHPHQFDLSEYIALFESAGLSMQRCKRIRRSFLFDYYAIVLTKHT